MSAFERLERQLVEALERHLRTGNPVRLPEAGHLVWEWFGDLSGTRTFHQAGPNPISYAEIGAYSRLGRLDLQPHHVELIRALDRAWLEHAYRQREGRTAPEGVKVLPRVSNQKLSAELLDGVIFP